jgi:serine/threonine protein kinase
MSQPNRCPECGAELPSGALGGLCPKCLLGAGLESRAEPAHEGSRSEAPTTPLSGTFVPPDAASLAAHFPQLEILELLGHGGMGAVYKARQPKLDRLVALKIIRPESAHDPAFAERFNREARMLARLSHPRIVAVYDFGEVSVSEGASGGPRRPLYFFLMEYVEGTNLRQLLEAGELLPQQALAIVPQICEALQFAHDEGIVHRDIKPENILLDKRGRVKIADFGLAKLVARSPQEFTLTLTHQVMGTPRYMAPEQMEGSHAVDHRADIYSLGVVFYEMLTGEVPMGHFDPPSKKVEVDVRLDEVVLRALAREPQRRYQHASDVKTDVESISHTPSPAQAFHSSRETPADNALVDQVFERMRSENAALDAIRSKVRLPAIFILIIGVISCSVWWIDAILPDPGPGTKEIPEWAEFLVYAITIVLVMSWYALCLTMIIGAVKLMRLTSYRWAKAASIVALSPIPTGPLWLVSLPLGVWCLVVLSKPEVKKAFRKGKDDFTEIPKSSRPENASPDDLAEKRAAKLVQQPAWGLIITGLISWITIPLAFWIPIIQTLTGPQRTFFQITFGVIPLVVGTIMAVAGFRMKRLEGYRLAMFAAMLPIAVLIAKLVGLSFGTLGINPADWVGTPIGLWVLVVLTRNDVKAAFDSKMRESRAAASQSARVNQVRRRRTVIALSIALPVLALACASPLLFLALSKWTTARERVNAAHHVTTLREIPETEAERNTPGLSVFRYELNMPDGYHAEFFTKLWNHGIDWPSPIHLAGGAAGNGRVELRLQQGEALSPDGRGKVRWDWRCEHEGSKTDTGGWIDDPFAGLLVQNPTWRGTEKWEFVPEKDYTVLVLRASERGQSPTPTYTGDPTKLAERIRYEDAWADVELHLNVRIRRAGTGIGDARSSVATAPSESEAERNVDQWKFHKIGERAQNAFDQNDLAAARQLAEEYLKLADKYPADWNYGNAIHDANALLGRIALVEGNLVLAKEHLLAAGKTTGSPQLVSFGPDLALAGELLARGETDAVLQYLSQMSAVLRSPEKITRLVTTIQRGETPPELNVVPISHPLVGAWSAQREASGGAHAKQLVEFTANGKGSLDVVRKETQPYRVANSELILTNAAMGKEEKQRFEFRDGQLVFFAPGGEALGVSEIVLRRIGSGPAANSLVGTWEGTLHVDDVGDITITQTFDSEKSGQTTIESRLPEPQPFLFTVVGSKLLWALDANSASLPADWSITGEELTLTSFFLQDGDTPKVYRREK